MIFLDNNVCSEALIPAPSRTVLDWFAAQAPSDLITPTITLAEVLYGIETQAARRRKILLTAAVEKMFAAQFQGRILPFDEDAARWFARIVAGREAAGRQISQFDAMIAAIARGIPVIDP